MSVEEFEQVNELLAKMCEDDEGFILACNFDEQSVGMKMPTYADFCILMGNIINIYIKNVDKTKSFSDIIFEIAAVDRMMKNAEKIQKYFDNYSE